MTAPNSKWPAGFERSKLAKLYPREKYWLAYQIRTKAERLFLQYPVEAEMDYLSAEISGLATAYSLLSDAAKLNELLLPQRKDEHDRERAAYVQSLLSNLKLGVLLDKKLRNTVEHFGEYLDDDNLEHTGFTSPIRYLVAFNVVFSRMLPIHEASIPFQLYKVILDLPVYPVRVYVASTRTFHNFSWSIDIGLLAEEAKQVMEAIRTRFGENKPEQWVSCAICL